MVFINNHVSFEPKVIKNYLRTAMVRRRLAGLTIISIENEMCKYFNYTNIMIKFAKAKAKKIHK